jgi:protease-4
MRESIFFASIRSLFITFFAVIGIVLGLIFVFMLLGAISSSDLISTKNTFSPIAVADAKGKRKILASDKPVILKVNIDGVIGTDSLTASTFRQMLVESREGALEDDRVKAIILRLSTPGGTVTDANGIYQALKDYKAQYHVPVIAYADGMCLSGGMYVASAADKIFASNASLVGSVGVILPPFFNASNLMEKVGLEALTIYAGKGKDEMNPTRPWKKDEQANLTAITDKFYDQFVNIVSSNRPNLPQDKLREYGAGIFVAKDALDKGYIDGVVDNFENVLASLAEQIGAKEGEYQVVELNNTDWFSKIFDKQEGMFGKSEVKLPIALPLELQPGLSGKWLYLYNGAAN